MALFSVQLSTTSGILSCVLVPERWLHKQRHTGVIEHDSKWPRLHGKRNKYVRVMNTN